MYTVIKQIYVEIKLTPELPIKSSDLRLKIRIINKFKIKKKFSIWISLLAKKDNVNNHIIDIKIAKPFIPSDKFRLFTKSK